MAQLLELSEKLQSTMSALAEVEHALSTDPDSRALTLMGESLRKRHSALEADFKAVAESSGTNVLSYRFIPDSSPKLLGLTSTLSNFQTVFSVVFDAQRNGPKRSSKVGAESSEATAFGFAYTFPGSVGFVLTVDERQITLLGESVYDDAIRTIFRLASAESSDEVLEFSRRLGPAPVRTIYQWAVAQVRFGLSAEIKWEHGDTRQELRIQYPQLRSLVQTIERTSEDTTDPNLVIVGELCAADTTTKRFKLNPEAGGEIAGKFADAISAEHTVELPKRYRATMTMTKRVKFSTEEEEISYFLTRLEPLEP